MPVVLYTLVTFAASHSLARTHMIISILTDMVQAINANCGMQLARGTIRMRDMWQR